MSQVLLFTPPFFRGTISDTPSGTAYHVKPGETVTANETDQAFLLGLGFSPAAPNAATGGYVMFVSYPLTRTQLLSLATSPVRYFRHRPVRSSCRRA